jgi:hypothetical protein
MLYSRIVERTVLRLLREEQHLTVDQFDPRQTELQTLLQRLTTVGRVEIVATGPTTMTYRLRAARRGDEL